MRFKTGEVLIWKPIHTPRREWRVVNLGPSLEGIEYHRCYVFSAPGEREYLHAVWRIPTHELRSRSDFWRRGLR